MEKITSKITILAPVQKVWDLYTGPAHIKNWNFASPVWHCPSAENVLTPNGHFSYRMEAKDGSFGFDFSGTFVEIVPHSLLKYRLDDGRMAEIQFIALDGNTTEVIQTFEPEASNPVEMQREGWYKILDNFHKYVENH